MALFDILMIVLVLSTSPLCVFLILYLIKISQQVEMVSKDIRRLAENTIPILSNLEKITQHANIIVTGVEGYWQEIDHSIITMRRKISNSGTLEKFRDTQTHILELGRNFIAIANGISAFWRKYKRR